MATQDAPPPRGIFTACVGCAIFRLPETRASETVEIALHELTEDLVGTRVDFDVGHALGKVLSIELQVAGQHQWSYWYCNPYPIYGYDYGEDYLSVNLFDQGTFMEGDSFWLPGDFDSSLSLDGTNSSGWEFLLDGQATIRMFYSTGEPWVVEDYGSTCTLQTAAQLELTRAVLVIEYEVLVPVSEDSWGAIKATFR